MNFSVIIPTYDRENALTACIDSICHQTLCPKEVVIIDDGALSQKFISDIKEKLASLDIELNYYRKDHSKHPKGSAESRNVGMDLANYEILFILDDDLILDPDFFEQIMIAWQEEKNERLIGVGGAIKNNRRKGRLERCYNKIFGLTSRHTWDVNRGEDRS